MATTSRLEVQRKNRFSEQFHDDVINLTHAVTADIINRCQSAAKVTMPILLHKTSFQGLRTVVTFCLKVHEVVLRFVESYENFKDFLFIYVLKLIKKLSCWLTIELNVLGGSMVVKPDLRVCSAHSKYVNDLSMSCQNMFVLDLLAFDLSNVKAS